MSDVGTISLDAAGTFAGPASLRFYVAALILEIVFFGSFVVTYSYGMWILFRAHPQTRRQRSIIALQVANTVMFLLSFVHLILDIYVARIGFFNAPPAMEAAKFMFYVSQTLIGDGFMIYRLYRVFGRQWLAIAVPSILLFADAVIGYSSTFLGIVGFYMSVGFYGLSLFINIICTVLIMWRVYWLSKEFQQVNRRKSTLKIWKVVEATVQSTAIYSAAAVSLVITFVNSTAIGYPTCLNVFPALIGLVFSFVVIRVAHNSTRDDIRPDSQMSPSSTGRGTFSMHSNAPGVEHPVMLPMRVPRRTHSHEPTDVSSVIVVHISKETSSDEDLGMPKLERDGHRDSEDV